MIFSITKKSCGIQKKKPKKISGNYNSPTMIMMSRRVFYCVKIFFLVGDILIFCIFFNLYTLDLWNCATLGKRLGFFKKNMILKCHKRVQKKRRKIIYDLDHWIIDPTRKNKLVFTLIV
jgi:hypothetical protein